MTRPVSSNAISDALAGREVLRRRIYPTAAQLREAFDYDPETGVIKWKIRPAIQTAIGSMCGTVDNQGYLIIGFRRQKFQAHRLIWIYLYGSISPHVQIDHINGVRSDNRQANLRLASISENSRNTKVRKDNTSGAKGVSLDKKSGRWIARIRSGGPGRHLGTFVNFEDACAAYAAAAEALHGSFVRASQAESEGRDHG